MEKQKSTYSKSPERRYVQRAKSTASGKDIDKTFEEVNQKIDDAIAGVYHFKGSVNTYEDLPTEDVEQGDVYNVIDTGTNYAWTGTEWDDLGGTSKIIVDNITALTSDECNMLSCGDLVIKQTGNQQHSYRVSYKENNVGMCLTYSDASTSETVSYNYTGGQWVYNSTDITPLKNVVALNNFDRTEEFLTSLQIGDTKYIPNDNPLSSSFVFSYNNDGSVKAMVCVITVKNADKQVVTFDEATEEANCYLYIVDEDNNTFTKEEIRKRVNTLSIGGKVVYGRKENVKYMSKGISIDSSYSEKTISFYAMATFKFNIGEEEKEVFYTSNKSTFTFPVIPAPETPQE